MPGVCKVFMKEMFVCCHHVGQLENRKEGKSRYRMQQVFEVKLTETAVRHTRFQKSLVTSQAPGLRNGLKL